MVTVYNTANRLGLQGIDSTKYTDKAAKIGTLIHAMVESHITGNPIEELKSRVSIYDILSKYALWNHCLLWKT